MRSREGITRLYTGHRRTYQASGPRPASAHALHGGVALSWTHLLLIRRHLNSRIISNRQTPDDWCRPQRRTYLRQAMGARRLMAVPPGCDCAEGDWLSPTGAGGGGGGWPVAAGCRKAWLKGPVWMAGGGGLGSSISPAALEVVAMEAGKQRISMCWAVGRQDRSCKELASCPWQRVPAFWQWAEWVLGQTCYGRPARDPACAAGPGAWGLGPLR